MVDRSSWQLHRAFIPALAASGVSRPSLSDAPASELGVPFLSGSISLSEHSSTSTSTSSSSEQLSPETPPATWKETTLKRLIPGKLKILLCAAETPQDTHDFGLFFTCILKHRFLIHFEEFHDFFFSAEILNKAVTMVYVYG